MATAYGTDRLEERPVGPDGLSGNRVIVSSRSKGWLARRPGTAQRADHPGTAVRWDGAMWEVVEVARAGGAVTYELAPWDDRNVYRVISDYSDEAERGRAAVVTDERRDDRDRTWLLLLSPLTGHLPGRVQERLERRCGASGTTMTLVSAVPWALFGTYCVFLTLAEMFGAMYGANVAGSGLLPAVPGPLRLLGLYLLVESGLRISTAVNQGRPAGSVIGTLLYRVFGPKEAEAEARTIPS